MEITDFFQASQTSSIAEFGHSNSSLSSSRYSVDLLSQLQEILKTYLSVKKHRTLNSLSKKCTISEPTLRRIYKGQIKTLPNSTTILDILSTISGQKNIAAIAKQYPGPVAKYIEDLLPQSNDCNTEYNAELHAELKDSVNYIIYKLASNANGVMDTKINELFGAYGVNMAQSLLEKKYLKRINGTYYSNVKNFTLSQEHFIKNFKTLSDFIKTQNSVSKEQLHSLLANYSESVSPQAYKEIITLQKKTLKKIRSIMSSESSRGHIPLFLLLAIDTLDNRPVYEIES
jgi:predicted HTH transcriptional regulator